MRRLVLMLTGREFSDATRVSVCEGSSNNPIMELYGSVIVDGDASPETRTKIYLIHLRSPDDEVCIVHAEGKDGSVGDLIYEGVLSDVITQDLRTSPGLSGYYECTDTDGQLRVVGRSEVGWDKPKEEASNLGDEEVEWFERVVKDLVEIKYLLRGGAFAEICNPPKHTLLETIDQLIQHNQAVLDSHKKHIKGGQS